MLNTGTDESTAMKITGHRTSSVFKRYRIVNLADTQRAVARLAQSGNSSAHPQGQRALPSGKVSAKISPCCKDKGPRSIAVALCFAVSHGGLDGI